MKLSFRQVMFASFLVSANTVNADTLSAKFDMAKSDIEALTKFGVKKFKAWSDHEGATIFSYELTFEGKVVATFAEDDWNGPSSVKLLDKDSMAILHTLSTRYAEPEYASLYEEFDSAADIFLHDIVSAHYLLNKVYAKSFSKELVFVDLLGNIDEHMVLGFKGNMPFTKSSKTEQGRAALNKMYWKHREQCVVDNRAGGFTVIVNTPEKLTGFGVENITPL